MKFERRFKFWIFAEFMVFAMLICAPFSLPGDEISGTPTAAQDKNTDNNDVPARSVAIELNKVDNSFGYDVEIRPYEQHWAKPWFFHIDNELLKLRLTPGHYKVHTRSYNTDKVAGRWSKWSPFWIQFKTPDVAFPPNNAKIKPMGDQVEKITFEWKKVPGAKAYVFTLKDHNGKVLKQASTADTWYVHDVHVSSKYTWQVKPLVDKHLEAPDQHYPFNNFEVLAPGEGMRAMRFEVGGNPKAVKYQFEFVRLNDNGEPTPPSMFDARESNFKVRLRPGRYETRVRTIDKDGAVSDWSTPQKFFIDFFPPVVLGPMKGQEVEADDDDDADVTLRWMKVPDVHHYRVYVFNKKGDLITSKSVETNEAKINLPHKQDYAWKVVAYSIEEPDRRPASIDDKDVNTFKISKFEKVDLNAAEESSAWYAWARTVTSQIDFTGQNYDNNSLINQKVLANAGELAGGVWIRKTHFGLLGNATLSGYRTASQTFTFTNYGLNVGYRHIYDEKSRLRVWLGYYTRELPELLANPYSADYTITKLRDSGPQLQVSYAHAIDDKWGWHTYGTFYYSMQGLATPNGAGINPQLSYQLGLAATYKINNYYTGMIGYAYKKEHAEYKSFDRSGNPNVIDFSGHYLNLILEFGLSKPHPN